MAALFGDPGGKAAQPRVVGNEEPGTLTRDPARPAHEPADRLAEEELGRRRRRVDADAQARDVHPSDTIRTATSHGSDEEANWAIAADALGIVRGDEPRGGAEPPAQQRGNSAGVLAVGCDHEAACVRLLAAHLLQTPVSGAENLGEPVSLERERGPQPLAGTGGVEVVVERRRVRRAVGRRPLHVAVRRREEDRPDDAPVGECVAVAVLEVRDGAVAGVGDERDRACVRAKRRSRERKPAAGRRERDPDRLAPGALLARVVQFVEDDERAPASRANSSAFVATWW